MELNIKKITTNDINAVMECATVGEYDNAYKLSELMSKFLDNENKGMWNDVCKLVYFYKLGVMQGKRAERSKRKSSQIIGGAL